MLARGAPAVVHPHPLLPASTTFAFDGTHAAPSHVDPCAQSLLVAQSLRQSFVAVLQT